MTAPRIWVLLGARTGDNNQALALAEALGVPFEVKQLEYNRLQALSVWLPATSATLTKRSRAALVGPWPDLVIAIGRRSVPVARWIKQRSGGKAKLVRIGHPRIDPKLFDLVVTTRQYPVPPGDNVLLLPVAMSRFAEPPPPTKDEEAFLAALPRPVRLVAIGGATKYWRLPLDRIVAAIETPGAAHTVIVTSRRTDPAIVDEMRRRAGSDDSISLVDGATPRFAVLMNAADEIFVTGDSISMISEGVLTGKPVAIIPIEQDEKGREKLGDRPQERGSEARRRDLRRFWNYLIDENMVGTLETGSKAAASIPNPNAIAAAAVRKLLGDLG